MSRVSIFFMVSLFFLSACASVDTPLEASKNTVEAKASVEPLVASSVAPKETSPEPKPEPEQETSPEPEQEASIVGIVVGTFPAEMLIGGAPFTPKAKVRWSDGKETEGISFSVENSDIIRKEGDILYAQQPGTTNIVFRSLRDSSIKESITITVLTPPDLPGPDPIYPLSSASETAFSVLNKYYLNYQKGMSWEYTIRYAGARFAFPNLKLALPNQIVLSKKMLLESARYDDIYDRVDTLFVKPNQNMGSYRITVTEVGPESVTLATELKSNSEYIASQAKKEKIYYSFDISKLFNGLLEDSIKEHSLAKHSQQVMLNAQYQNPAVAINTDKYISALESITTSASKNKELIAYFMHPELGVIQKIVQTHHEYSQLSLDSQIILELTAYSPGGDNEVPETIDP